MYEQYFLDSESDSSEEEFEEDVLLSLCRKRKRNYWCSNFLTKRVNYGKFHALLPDLTDVEYFKYLRLTKKQFEEVHKIIEKDIEARHSFFRASISTREKLAVCLRYFSTGCSFHDLSFNFRLGESTVGKIVETVSDAIWLRMQPLQMPEPDEAICREKTTEFYRRWQFPNCVSAVDGKHVVIRKPINSGSSYFNYKKTFSIVLMAGVDASYKFTFIDVGSQGRFSDGNIFANSNFGKRLHKNLLKLPVPEPNSLPFVLIGDEAFQLTKNFMRPYPGCHTKHGTECKIFNYRLSRARQTVECTFGILSARWKIYKKPFEVSLRKVDKIIKATCVLHNYLRNQNTIQQQINEFDATDFDDPDNQLLHFPSSNIRSSNEAFHIRKRFTEYFTSEEGSVEWQIEAIRKGKY